MGTSPFPLRARSGLWLGTTDDRKGGISVGSYGHKQLARKLRSEATPEENKLWYDFLSKYPVRFLRQRPIGRYIVDFYCPSRKIAIEIDGKQHEKEDIMEYDRIRTEFLSAIGIAVMRFTNNEINTCFKFVRDTIQERVPAASP